MSILQARGERSWQLERLPLAMWLVFTQAGSGTQVWLLYVHNCCQVLQSHPNSHALALRADVYNHLDFSSSRHS
jgi:hypothetical protein